MAINVTHLRSFWHVAQEASFTKAARTIGISQPTLTRQVHALERDYAVSLFERNTRRLELTQEGHQLLQICEPIFRGLDSVQDFLQAQNRRSVRLHSVQNSGLTDFLIFAYRNFPNFRFDVEIRRSTRVLTSLMERECDFGLLTVTEAPEELEYFKIASEPIVALVREGHPWRKRDRISIRELDGKPVILASRTGESRLLLDANLTRHDVAVDVVQVVDSNEVVWDLVSKGAGIGVIGHTGLVEKVVGHHLTFEEKSMAIDVHFACRRDRLLTKIYALMFELARSQVAVEAKFTPAHPE